MAERRAMAQPEQLIPPDDTGSDTFARFKYQAHVTFPYCFELTRDQAIENVFVEHIEDIALDLGVSWRFLQVKTRDAGLGPWTFSEVVRNGAIRSLWRAYEAVGPSLDATYELQLEGALKNGDVLVDLAFSEARDAVFRGNLASAIGVDDVTDIDFFANRLRIRDLPLRSSIIADNLRLIGRAAPHLPAGEIERIYEAALVAIESAMTADRLDGIWPASLFSAPDERFRLRIESKRISRDRAQQIFAPILRPVVPASDASLLSTETAARLPPFILPQLDVLTFTGRSYELAYLEAILLREKGEKVSSIAGVSGSGGVGKSALACHFAELHRNDFLDGVIGLRVDGKEPIAIAREFARCAFAELDPDDDRDASAIMQEVFRHRRALLIFDNADAVSVRSLLPGGTRCAVIITTRDRGLPVVLGIPDYARLDLSPLSLDEAVALLERLVGERISLDGDAARRISELVGNLPLAIQIVGATLQVQAWRSLVDYESALREEKERLSILCMRGDSELDVRASFSLSLRLLDSIDIDFFAGLSVCAQDGFSILGAAASNGADEGTAQERLTQLFRLSLVNRSSVDVNRFVLHPLIRLFAREQAEERGLLELAETRHRDFFTVLVKTRDANDPRVAALLGEEMDDIVAAAESMQRGGLLDYGFVIRLEPFFQRYGYWEKAASIFAAFLSSAERAADWVAVVQLQLQQAKFLLLRGKLTEAERLLVTLESLIDRVEPEDARRRATAMLLNTLGGVLQRQGKFDEAVEMFRKSGALDQESGNRGGEAKTLNSLGGALQRQGKFGDAADMFRRSAVIDEELGNRRGEAIALNSLGGVLQRQGDFDGAILALQRSEQLLTLLGDARGEAMVLNSLGGVLQRKGDFAGAVEALSRSVAIETRVGNKRGEAMVLNSMGGVLQRQGKFDEAVEAFGRSQAISEELHDQRSVAMVLNSLGGVLQRQGKFDEAVEAFGRSQAISEELHDQRSVAMVLNSMGGVLQRQGKFDEAAPVFRKSVAIGEELRDRRHLAMALNSLGGVLQRQGKFDEAVEAYRRSYDLLVNLTDVRGQAMVLNSLGGVLQRHGMFEEAVAAFRASIAIGEKLRDKRHLAMVHTAFGRSLLKSDPEASVRELRVGFELDAALHNRKGVGIVAPILVETLVTLGRAGEAAAICDRALSVTPGDRRLLRLKRNLASDDREK
jgi:tetratricopeptide (TPR) repeat protein